jgi:hypothetical protein
MRFDTPVPAIKRSVVQLQCTICKAETSAACSCGAIYMVKPAARAAAAITGNSSRSDRSIAAEIGVSPTTVGRARDQLSSNGQFEDFRTGKDGKTRKLPSYIPDPEPVIRDGLIEQAMDVVRQMTPPERVQFVRQMNRERL